ncbi:hypothetical protein D3C86_2054710 [compost metagenome]
MTISDFGGRLGIPEIDQGILIDSNAPDQGFEGFPGTSVQVFIKKDNPFIGPKKHKSVPVVVYFGNERIGEPSRHG